MKADHALGSILAQRGKPTADVIEGATWLELAWRDGDADVIDELKKLRATLTAAQRAAVKARVEAHLRKLHHH